MKILNLDNWCGEAEEIIKPYLFTEGDPTWCEGVITDLKPFNPKGWDNLKFVASCTTGLDHIDLDYCKAKGIKIISLQGETDFLQDVYATAEHTFALILSLIRKVPFCHNEIINLSTWQRENWRGTELHDKTMGIVGCGRVGRQVAKIAESFGMCLLTRDIKPSTNQVPDLKYLLKSSDIITAHVSLDKSTQCMFGIKEFQQMKPTSCFINTSRGAVVDEDALLWSLTNKKIAGAALDVACNEPNINHNLIEYAKANCNLILTCHIGGNTHESRKKTQLHIAFKIKEFIESHC